MVRKEVFTGTGIMSSRSVAPPAKSRRTLSNRKAIPLSTTGEMTVKYVTLDLFAIHIIYILTITLDFRNHDYGKVPS